jgi:hypothetical protein
MANWSPSLGPTGGTLHDVSGRHNNGTLTDMDPATDWVVDEKGYSLEFDGSSHYVPFPTTTSSDFMLQQPATISCWAKRGAVSFTRTMVTIGRSFHPLRLEQTTGDEVRIRRSSAVNVVTSTGGQFGAASGWRHIAGTYDGTNIELHVDGVSYGTTASGNMTDTSPIPWAIGAESGGFTFFAGQIGPTAVYRRAISRAEIQLLFERPNAILERKSRSYPVATAAPPAGGNPWNYYAQQAALVG